MIAAMNQKQNVPTNSGIEYRTSSNTYIKKLPRCLWNHDSMKWCSFIKSVTNQNHKTSKIAKESVATIQIKLGDLFNHREFKLGSCKNGSPLGHFKDTATDAVLLRGVFRTADWLSPASGVPGRDALVCMLRQNWGECFKIQRTIHWWVVFSLPTCKRC